MTEPYNLSGCADPMHFEVVDGTISPQPWMQWRQVESVTVPSKARSYATSGGGNKNDLVQTLQTTWTNNAPIEQWVYGLVSRGGCRVTLQARSRGYLTMAHGFALGVNPGPLTEVSRVGVGADVGLGGILALGTSFCVAETRQNSVTMPLRPDLTGWTLVGPGVKFTARVELRFISENWEGTTIDGGDSSTESEYVTGETRLDLFAVPAL